MKYEKEYRKAHPETINEADTYFDRYNYTNFLESELEKEKKSTEFFKQILIDNHLISNT